MGTRRGAGSPRPGGGAQGGSDTLGGGGGAQAGEWGAAGVGVETEAWWAGVDAHTPHHHPQGPCPQHPCLLGAPHPPDRVRCSSCWPQDPGRRVGTVAPAPSGTAQHSHARGPARSLGSGRGGWASGRGGAKRPSDGSHSPAATPGLPLRRPPPQPSSAHLCPLHRAAGRRVPSPGGPRGRGHHHSWAGGPHSFSDDSDGRPHTRRCRAPRPPTQPRPQPLQRGGRRTGVNQAVNLKSCNPPRESRAKGPSSLGSGQRGGLGQRPEDSAASSRVPGKPP